MITPENKKTIENLICENPHYKDNEELFDEFLNEIITRLEPSLEILKNQLLPQTYLEKVVKKGILNVLKKHELLSSLVEVGYGILKEISPFWSISKESASHSGSFDIDQKGEISFNIPYPTSTREDKGIITEQLKLLIKNLEKINENEPEKQYLKIFDLKYNKNLSIEEIAKNLGLSVENLSKRLQDMLLKLNEC